MAYTMTDFDGRNGRALNLKGFINFQTPVPFSAIEKAVADGKIIAISPEGIARMNEDLIKGIENDFEGVDRFNEAVLEIRNNYKALLVERNGENVEFLVKALPQDEEEDEEDMEKGGGEGSRGGKVIGHTRSGKPIYASRSASHKSYSDFSDDDHEDAAAAHNKEADSYQKKILNSKRGGSGKSANSIMLHQERAASHSKRPKK